jgi:methionyl-tRNA formyltransferase
VVCTVKPWNIAAFKQRSPKLPGRWHLMESPEQLTPTSLEQIAPRYVFFPHWSWRVDAGITSHFECVCFHMTDVPYGRGGSPLQNLIVRGHTSTMLSALRMVDALDAGPVYLKRPLSLAGRAEDIFERAADLIYDLIDTLVAEEPAPIEQRGEVVTFPRRTPKESVLPQSGAARELYDFIRMLDAPTYPKAFLDWGEWRLEFDHALMAGEGVEAHVAIRRKERS